MTQLTVATTMLAGALHSPKICGSCLAQAQTPTDSHGEDGVVKVYSGAVGYCKKPPLPTPPVEQKKALPVLSKRCKRSLRMFK